MRGLLGRDTPDRDEALLILDCRSVHTIGMRFTIRVAFLDARFRVIEEIRMQPNRICRPRLRARHVLEVADQETKVGPLVPTGSHSDPRHSSTVVVPPAQSPPQ